MRHNIHILLLVALLAVLPACTKTEPQQEPTPEPVPEVVYVQPEAEKILLAAGNAAVETNGAVKVQRNVTVYFAETFSYEGKEYDEISIDEQYVLDFNLLDEGVSIKFKDKVSVLLPYQKNVEMDIDATTKVCGYPKEKTSIPFSVTKAGNGNVSFVIEGENGFSPNVIYDDAAKTGKIEFTFNQDEGVTDQGYVIITDGKARRAYSIQATSYHFTVSAAESIVLDGEGDSSAPTDIVLDTDAPDCFLGVKTEGNFFALSEDNRSVSTLNDNKTDDRLEGTIILYDGSGHFSFEKYIPVYQENLPAGGDDDHVRFASWNLKNAILGVADTDGDEEVSFEEALAVRELVLKGKEISDLIGLESFKNVWKLDLRDNRIVDASCLKQLPNLYWLDLKGNKELQTFDVTGCTQYFQHCEFDLTDNLSYYTFRQQVGIINTSDPTCAHSHHVVDERVSTDFTEHGKVIKIQEHTKENGNTLSIVFSGLGYLDVDFQDGSWKRLLDTFADAFWGASPITEYREYFDIYYVEWIVDNRNKYYCSEQADWSSEEFLTAKKNYQDDILELRQYCHNITNETESNNIQLALFINNNPERTTFFGCPVSAGYATDEIEGQYYECFYTHSRIGANLTGEEQEKYYNAIDYRSVLPEDFFTNPELYSENAKIFDTKFLKKCGLVE